ADRLTGGGGGGKFVFNKTTESRTAGGPGFIVDFSRAQHDKIVLSAIDANTHAAGNQAFHFIGTSRVTHHAGELRYHKADGHSYVDGDINGDGVADFTIVSGLPVALARGDFVL